MKANKTEPSSDQSKCLIYIKKKKRKCSFKNEPNLLLPKWQNPNLNTVEERLGNQSLGQKNKLRKEDGTNKWK